MSLTQLQQDVLHVVREHGPVTAHDVTYHLPIRIASARGVLSRLEARNLIAASYSHPIRGRSRAYVARRFQ